MGYMRHHAIVVTCFKYETLHEARTTALALGCQVSDIVASRTNGFHSFFVAPDGSKEGWEESDDGNRRRDLFTAYLRNPNLYLDWVEVQYGDDNRNTEIIRDGDDVYREDDRRVTVFLPEPGAPQPHHTDTETIWYHNAAGEFSYDSYNRSLHDEKGNTWGAGELRELAAAALAAADHYDRQIGEPGVD